MSEPVKHQLILVLLCAVVYMTNLGGAHLWDEDEAYFGSTVVEMVERGDHVVPYFNGEISLHKPAFMYWIMMAGMWMFGENEFGLRFGSTLFSIGTVLLTYHAARMLFNARIGFWSAAALATCLQFMVVSRAALSDPELIFFCTLSLVIFLAARFRNSASDEEYSAASGNTGLSWRAWVCTYTAMAFAVLVKGPVGIVLPTACLGLFLLLEHADLVATSKGEPHRELPRFKRTANWFASAFWPTTILRTIWAMRPLTALAVLVAVAAPWYIWVGLRTDGEWLHGFFVVHNVGRFSGTFENHSGGPLYYMIASLIGMFPWCIFFYQSMYTMITRLGVRDQRRTSYLFLISVVVVWIGVFSISATKLPHYILPCYPAIAILYGAFIGSWLSREMEWNTGLLKSSWGVMLVSGIGLTVGMGFALNHFLPNEMHLMLVGVVPMIGGAIGFWAQRNDQRPLAAATLLVTSVLFMMGVFSWAGPQISQYNTSPQMARWIHSYSQSDAPQIKSYEHFEESLIFYSGRNVELLGDSSAVVNYFQQHRQDAFLVTTRDALDSMAYELPADVVALESTPRFMRPGELVLLGRNRDSASAAGTTAQNSNAELVR